MSGLGHGRVKPPPGFEPGASQGHAGSNKTLSALPLSYGGECECTRLDSNQR